MALLEILEFPDPRLRKKAKPITKFDGKLKQLADDMLETMYDAPGIGLAATQVDVHKQMLVMDVSEEKDQAIVVINPTITPLTEEKVETEEGCLSVPGYTDAVHRPDKVRLDYQDLEGKEQSMECEGLLAICVQHEMDHLNGKLFVDYLSSLKRNRVKKRLEKAQREEKNRSKLAS